MITSLYSLSRSRSEYRLVIAETEATNCFSINFQVFTKKINTTLQKFTSEKIFVKILFAYFRYKIVCLHKFSALCRVATRPVIFQIKTLQILIDNS